MQLFVRHCRFQTLVAVMLSSQTKDEQTAAAMGRLKKHGLSVKRYSMFLLSLGIDHVSVTFIIHYGSVTNVFAAVVKVGYGG